MRERTRFSRLMIMLVTLVMALAVTACGDRLGSDDDDSGTGGGGSGGGGGGGGGNSTYDVEVRRTQLGIPHIKALRDGDYASVGYGLGYAFAEDNLCVLMEDLITIRGQRAEFFGRSGIDGRYNGYLIPANGAFANNVDSDFFWKFMATDAAITPLRAAAARGNGEAKAASKGFADGFNRYIREIKAGGHAGRHADCRAAPWLAEISEDDMYRRYFRLGLLASSSVFVPGIATAQPPALALPSTVPAAPGGAPGGGGGLLCTPEQLSAIPVIGNQCSPVDPTASAAGKTRAKPLSKASMIAALKRDPGPLAAFQPENKDKFGSNMYAFGKDATESGVPMVFGNPHFPWIGTERLYISHLTIPGQGDIMGSSLYGVPAVLIGFNRHFAWSHTVSTAFRFTFYELTVNPANPTQYLYDGALRDMTAVPVMIKVREDNGDLTDQSRTLYRTHFGPMVGLAVSGVNILPWTNLKAYTLRDANAENDRLIQQFFAWNKAQSLEEFKSLHKSILGVPWVNTVASGPNGKAYYGDVTVVPHVTDEKIQTCRAIPLHDVIQQVSPGLPVLDGSRSACEWGTDDDAPAPGIFGPGNLPTLERDDYVHNCNDSYWLTNPNEKIEGKNSIIGAEGTARSLRTRLCILQAQRHLGEVAFPAGAPNFDTDSNQKFDMKELQDTVLSSYIYSAELARGTVTGTICQPGTVIGSNGPVAVGPACAVLSAWNQTGNLDAKGAHLWREFWRRTAPNAAGVGPNPLLWTTPFSAGDPVNTPRGLNPVNPFAQRALGDAVTAVEAAGFALDEPMGNVQKSGVHTLAGRPDIPIFGGEGSEGAFTIMSGGNITDGYRVNFGNSYIQTVTWDSNNPAGANPIAEGFITYSQSTDPASPNFSNFTSAYSAKQWQRFPFSDAEIAAQQVGATLHLQQ
jgi:acyl-homoserine-lactone acylase